MTMKKSKRRVSGHAWQPGGTWARLAGAACVLLVLAGCAASQPRAGASVEERAQARWDALLSGDLDTAYSLYSPGYRSSTSRVDFEIGLRTRPVRWTSASVQESRCEDDACTVVAKVGYLIGAPLPGVPEWKSDRLVEERWVRTDGKWWYVPHE